MLHRSDWRNRRRRPFITGPTTVAGSPDSEVTVNGADRAKNPGWCCRARTVEAARAWGPAAPIIPADLGPHDPRIVRQIETYFQDHGIAAVAEAVAWLLDGAGGIMNECSTGVPLGAAR